MTAEPLDLTYTQDNSVNPHLFNVGEIDAHNLFNNLCALDAYNCYLPVSELDAQNLYKSVSEIDAYNLYYHVRSLHECETDESLTATQISPAMETSGSPSTEHSAPPIHQTLDIPSSTVALTSSSTTQALTASSSVQVLLRHNCLDIQSLIRASLLHSGEDIIPRYIPVPQVSTAA